MSNLRVHRLVSIGEDRVGQGQCLGQQAGNLHVGDAMGGDGIQKALCLGASEIASLRPGCEGIAAQIDQ